jgi:hypothetical protein
VANLPLVLTTQTANYSTSFASVFDTGGKFATSAAASTIRVANNGNNYQTADNLK